jgi:hypothetical protein
MLLLSWTMCLEQTEGIYEMVEQLPEARLAIVARDRSGEYGSECLTDGALELGSVLFLPAN